MVIGVTGKSGSGKTTVANYIGECLTYKVIHGDELAHEVLTLSLYNEVLSWFRKLPEERVNRKRLGELLFSDESMMDKYNCLMNEKILNLFKEYTKNEDNYIIDWNFLPISELFTLCDKNILLVASDETRKKRVKLRDDISDEYFDKRDKAGLEYNEEMFDFILTSDEILNGVFDLERLNEVYGS